MITKALARKLRQYIEKASVSLSDADALEAVELYPLWQPGTAYTVDFRARDGQTLYRCVQAHTSQAGWEPHLTPALWTVVSLDEWPEWVQPTGAQDAYMTGDKCTFEGEHYINDVDYNIYAPNVYGWHKA